MRRITFGGAIALAGLALVSSVAPSFALRVAAPPPGPERMKYVDYVIVGRVVGLANKDVKVQNQNYRVAFVAVNEMIKGKKKQKMIRVGYVLYKAPAPPRPGVPVIRPIPRPGGSSPQFTVGQHGLMYLKKHPKADFYTAPMYYDFVASTNASYFESQRNIARFTIKFGDHPEKSLNSKDAAERFLGVAVMLQNWNRPTGRPPFKRVPVDAKVSQQILTEILKGDWSKNDQYSPWNLFNQLRVSAQDGYTRPRRIAGQDSQTYIESLKTSAKAWLAKNVKTFRVMKYVGGKGNGGRPIRPGLPPIRIQPVPVPLPQPVPPIRIQPGIPVPPVQIRPVRPIQIQPAPIQVPGAVPQPAPAQGGGAAPAILPQAVPGTQTDPAPRN